MSYDLVVFEPVEAPNESTAFLSWYESQSEESLDASELESAGLASFFEGLRQDFPAMNGPHATDDIDNPKITDYSFGQHSIYMAFGWSQAAEARQAVLELAQKHGVGFYDISDPKGFRWWPPGVGEYSVFYCFYGLNESVPSEQPACLGLREIVSSLLPKLSSDSDFLGVVDSNGVTVQFMFHEADNQIWMEIPSPERQGSYGAYFPPESLGAIVAGLPPEFSVSAFPDLTFQSWDEPAVKKPWWKFW